jgi:Putative Actinobacterial Holin-X, holin superfamily III
MARHMNNENYPIATVENPNPNWPELLSKTVDDLSRVARTEIELLEASLKRLVETQTDKITGMLVLVIALAYGSVFLLGGVVLLIHLWLAWWLSFLITGMLICSSGVAFQMQMAAAAKKK